MRPKPGWVRCPTCYSRIPPGEFALVLHRVNDNCPLDPNPPRSPRRKPNAEVQREPKPPAVHVPVHGTRNEYAKWGCRCDPCHAAYMAYKHAWAERRRAAGLPARYDKKNRTKNRTKPQPGVSP